MSDQITITDKVALLTVFRGERGDPGSGNGSGSNTAAIEAHNQSTLAHPDIRLALNSKATPYNHVQSSMSTSWVINHNLNKYPSISVVMTNGTEVKGSIIHSSYNVCNLVFAVAISGTAYCV